MTATTYSLISERTRSAVKSGLTLNEAHRLRCDLGAGHYYAPDRKPWSAPVVVERFDSVETGETVERAELENADGLTHIQRFPSRLAVLHHVRRTGLRVVSVKREPVYRLVSIPNAAEPERTGSALDAVRLAVRDMSNTGESWPGKAPARDSYAPKPW
jgi:hypothetical protein